MAEKVHGDEAADQQLDEATDHHQEERGSGNAHVEFQHPTAQRRVRVAHRGSCWETPWTVVRCAWLVAGCLAAPGVRCCSLCATATARGRAPRAPRAQRSGTAARPCAVRAMRTIVRTAAAAHGPHMHGWAQMQPAHVHSSHLATAVRLDSQILRGPIREYK
jgi:hypothetical protein